MKYINGDLLCCSAALYQGFKTTVRLGEVITHVMKSLTRKEMKDCFDVHAEFVLACGFSDFQRAKIPE